MFNKQQTNTGIALSNFFSDALSGVPCSTYELLEVLKQDMLLKTPSFSFGLGQECTHELLIHLLDMVNDQSIRNLFLSKYRKTRKCNECNTETRLENIDENLTIELFMDMPKVDSIIYSLYAHKVQLEDCVCEVCKKQTNSTTTYALVTIPEIVFCIFNLYTDFKGERKVRNYPLSFTIPHISCKQMKYKLVSQINQYGSMSSGHYHAIGTRSDGVYLFNDAHYESTTFKSTENTCAIVYHYDGFV
jgi:ubiquitin C-terminal hydrolase